MPNNRALASAALILLMGMATAADDIITTVAGGGNADGYPATNTFLAGPISCICGPDGSIYISEWSRHRIRKIAAGTGIITTFAGNGQIGSSGLGGPALAANIVDPCGMAFDAAGDLYLTDRGTPSAGGNHRICKITMSTGIITLVAGNGSSGFSGDGGLAVNAQFNWPTGITFDAAGNLYITDQRNHRVRRVDASTKIVTTVAGDGVASDGGDGGAAISAHLNNPNGVSFDAAGNLYISDEYNHRIRQVTFPGGVISTVAGNGTSGFSGDGGSPTAAQISQAGDVWVDTNGDVYLVDVGNHRVRLVSGGIITTIAGGGIMGLGDGGPATSARFGNFWNVVLTMDAAKNLVIADFGNNRIRMVTRSTGKIATLAGGGDISNVPATAAGFSTVNDVAVDSAGNRYIASLYASRVYRVEAGTGLVSVIAGNGEFGMSGDGGAAVDATLGGPTHLALDGLGNLYVSFASANRVRRIDLGAGKIYACAGTGTAGFSGDGASATLAQLDGPKGLACDAANNLFIVDSGNHRIRCVPAGGGNITTVVGNGSASSSGDGGTAINAGLAAPEDLAFTAAGALIIVGADIRRVVLSGGTGISTLPVAVAGRGVAINGAGDLFISSSTNSSVMRVAAGTYSVSTICAGSGSDGFAGDGGSASAALLYQPEGLAFDQAGSLLIADRYNGRVRQVAFAGAGSGGGGSGGGSPPPSSSNGSGCGLGAGAAALLSMLLATFVSSRLRSKRAC
jgi:sugar lactone lactonase YvrE